MIFVGLRVCAIASIEWSGMETFGPIFGVEWRLLVQFLLNGVEWRLWVQFVPVLDLGRLGYPRTGPVERKLSESGREQPEIQL